MTGSGLVFEAVLAFLETVRQLLDGSESNDTFFINKIDLVRDFGIGKIFNQRKWMTVRISSDIKNAKRTSNLV
jgi:hypothetical protein